MYIIYSILYIYTVYIFIFMYSLYFITFQTSGTRPVTKPLRSIRPEQRGTFHTQFWLIAICVHTYVYNSIYIYICTFYTSWDVMIRGPRWYCHLPFPLWRLPAMRKCRWAARKCRWAVAIHAGFLKRGEMDTQNHRIKYDYPLVNVYIAMENHSFIAHG